MNILFNDSGNPYSSDLIRKSIENFKPAYKETVWEIIKNSEHGLNRQVFYENLANLMPSFKMTRRGPFYGVKLLNGHVEDPNHQIEKCWIEIGDNVVDLRKHLDRKIKKNRRRVLIELPSTEQKEINNRLWVIFKKLLPICMGKTTPGRVGASKVLFAVLPEVALPIDNTQWRAVFKTIDYGDIIRQMATEITEWEKIKGTVLDSCEPSPPTTLPSIYNVMAMRAKSKKDT